MSFLEKNPRDFGDAMLLGDNGDAFFDMSVEEQAEAQGYSEACPVVPPLIKPEAEGGRGALVMRDRYGALNFWFKYIIETLVRAGKKNIVSQLTTPRPREAGEPLGNHEPGWPPTELETHIYRTPMAYALPRMLVEFLKSSSDVALVLELLDKSIEDAQDDVELVIFFAERIIAHLTLIGMNDQAILVMKHLVSFGKLKEENTYKLYRFIFRVMEGDAFLLWSFYEWLDDSQKSQFRIINNKTDL